MSDELRHSGETPKVDDSLMRDIVGWDVRTWTTAIRFWDDEVGSTSAPLMCLEIGAGPGGPSLWLALKGHKVVCSNREWAEAHARPLHDRYPDAHGITYEDIDVTAIPYENHFDLIVFKSVLGGVATAGADLPRQAMEQILIALKPGGRLLFAENVRGSLLHRAARAIAYRLRRASWRFPSVKEIERLLANFHRNEVRTTGVLAMFGITEPQRHALAGADARLLNRAVPRSWQYVSYGVAHKQIEDRTPDDRSGSV
jgi:SAM-dependent methyltransferase